MKNSSPTLIYNLFPRVFKTIDDWSSHVEKIASMNFNSIYVNPFHTVGGSKSLYAVDDYFKLNPDFLKPGADPKDFSPLKKFLKKCDKYNIQVYMDLVINHTANESVLVKEHPEWFKKDENGNIVHPYAIDPANPSNVTVWGDLSEINYDDNPDMDGLIAFWQKMLSFYQDLGISGYRCDAAYKIPSEVWKTLINTAKKRNPKSKFLAETLGCTLEQTMALQDCGFDYLFNSSKWWNFEAPWCIDQHCQFKSIAPSISFPESHDTTRLSSDPPGSLHMQKNRYLLSALFSKGLLMPIGYEFGTPKGLHVVNSSPEDLSEKKWDIQDWISNINKLKLNTDILKEEGSWRAVSGYDWDLLFLIKESNHNSGSLGVVINKDWHNTRNISEHEIPNEISAFKALIQPFNDPNEKRPNKGPLFLSPSEIALFSN
ncbi:alpha-amylase family glycosyl hydrolase [Chitinispirillales bacterium ANBcel5]|uniref:alpha-amylase family glycosyl hydrolase n=1 Tax=Cellulosispirillum alkaliphilum TaxID=3039283 RepID=UPI002A504D43|nr:alpha-amylase family glycosyl hydrolase [Chitinispirillales bacterium ANBcel5]